MTRAGLAALLVPAVLAASAVGHATAGPGAPGPAIVTVGEGRGAVATGFGAGRDRVVTVAHVLRARVVTVRGADGVARPARVVRRDDALDLAVLSVPGLPEGRAVAWAGTRVQVMRDGAGEALPARVLRRVTARVRAAGASRVTPRPALEVAVDSRPGDSGAPVLEDGRVTGILFARSRDRERVAYAVDASVLAPLLR